MGKQEGDLATHESHLGACSARNGTGKSWLAGVSIRGEAGLSTQPPQDQIVGVNRDYTHKGKIVVTTCKC